MLVILLLLIGYWLSCCNGTATATVRVTGYPAATDRISSFEGASVNARVSSCNDLTIRVIGCDGVSDCAGVSVSVSAGVSGGVRVRVSVSISISVSISVGDSVSDGVGVSISGVSVSGLVSVSVGVSFSVGVSVSVSAGVNVSADVNVSAGVNVSACVNLVILILVFFLDLKKY